jgi:outer membrane protein assembly factor BamB
MAENPGPEYGLSRLRDGRPGRHAPLFLAAALGVLALSTDLRARDDSPSTRVAVVADAASVLESCGVQGGIVAHLGCGDGTFTAALCSENRFLVHGLDVDAANVAKARRHIDSLGLYGRVSAERYDGRNLPYGDNMVNLVVVSRAECRVPEEEILRALVPGGVAVVGGEKTVKPWPPEIDEWTHFLYDASGNGVSKDRKVRCPRHTQWYAGPKFSRHHDALASLSAMTSSKGRLFYIYDEGPVSVMHRPAQWKLIARDAFNGRLLWKRDIPTWMTHLYNFRAGPAELPRRLVSVGDTVYTTLGWNTPAEKLDAATGKTMLTYAGSQGASELVYHDGMLLMVIGSPDRHIETSDGATGYWDWAEVDVPPRDKTVVACDAATGELAWRFKTSATERRIGWENHLASPLWVHGSVLVVDGTVYFAAGHSSNLDGGIRLYGLDLSTGEQLHGATLASGHWGGDGQWGFLSDILSSEDGSRIGMRRTGFDRQLKKGGRGAIQSETSFLDASWFHRKQWRRGGSSGKLVVFGEGQTVAAVNIYTGLKQRRKVTNLRQGGGKWNQVGHLHQKFTRYLEDEWFPVGTDIVSKGKGCSWRIHETLQPRAMVLAADKLCVAGWRDAMVVKLKSGRPKDPDNPDPRDSLLRLYANVDGAKLWECDLSAEPVFDGMAVAGGRLYLSTKDGRLTCFGALVAHPPRAVEKKQEEPKQGSART